MTGYYESVNAVFQQYGDEMNQIIAECIFEQQSESDADFAVSVNSEAAANAEIHKLIEEYETMMAHKYESNPERS